MTNSVLIGSLHDLYSQVDSYKEAGEYASGLAPEAFVSARLARAFRAAGTKFRINWCSQVIAAVSDRLELTSTITESGNAVADAILDEVWEDNLLGIEVGNIHDSALTYGETYVIVWTDDEGKPKLYHHEPSSVRVFYDSANKRVKTHAIKVWNDGGYLRVDVYYPDRVERYVSVKKITEAAPEKESDFEPYWEDGETPEDWVIENPFGEVPVFHFRTKYPHATPEHIEAYGPQNILNKLVVSQMNAVDFVTFPQRYALEDPAAMGGDDPSALDFASDSDDELDTDDQTALHASPGTLQVFKGFSSVGTFATGDPKQYLDPITAYVEHLGIVTGTPTHLLEKGSAPQSGAARRAQESVLIAKVGKRQRSFGATWKELFNFILDIYGIDERVQLNWAPIYVAGDDIDFWDVAEKKLAFGVPREVILREAGYTDSEVLEFLNPTQQAPEEVVVEEAPTNDLVETEVEEEQPAA